MEEDNSHHEKTEHSHDSEKHHGSHERHHHSEKHDPSEEKVTFTITKIRLWQGLTFLFAILFILSWFTGGFGGDNNPSEGIVPTPSVNPGGNGGSPAAVRNAEDFVDDDPFLGDENAPLTIVEFSDFQCPFCSRFHTQTLGLIKEQYIDTGKVKFVYRDFPLTSIHPEAGPAAEAAECANEQGKFWDYHDILFENQALLSKTSYIQWAEDLELDKNQFEECIDSGKYRSEVQDDLRDAAAAGGRGTPYFIVGSTPLSGAQPFPAFQAAIEAELNK